MLPTTSIEFDKRNYHVSEKFINGDSFVIRSIRPDDKENLRSCMRHLSDQSRYYRFFTPKNQLTEKELVYFTEFDLNEQVGLIATHEVNGVERPLGIAQYFPDRQLPTKESTSDRSAKPKSAEAAFAVEEEFQGQGIATTLLQHLIRIALADGIEEFTCLILDENAKMIEVLLHSGLRIIKFEEEPGASNFHLSLAPFTIGGTIEETTAIRNTILKKTETKQ